MKLVQAIENFTPDQWIQVANTLGTWVAAIGTVAAVGLSLYFSKKSERVKLTVYFGVLSKATHWKDPNLPKFEEYVGVRITNLADRPVIVEDVTWAVGKGKRRTSFKPLCIRSGSLGCPIELHYGKSAECIDSMGQFLAAEVIVYLGSAPDKLLDTLVAEIHTSAGQTIQKKADRELIARIRDYRSTPRYQDIMNGINLKSWPK